MEKQEINNNYNKCVILYNDEINSFSDVFEKLIKITEKNPNICQRIMFEAHTNGKSIVHFGSIEECETICNKLILENLKAEII